MLGERAEWLLDVRRPPDYRSNAVVEASYLDGEWDIAEPCHETWALWEQRDADRGVQLVQIGAGSITGPPEGGGQVFVRVFDRDRAASVAIDTVHATTVGEVDPGPLDLLACSTYFYLEPSGQPRETLETLRGIIAQLAGELDAHYDTSPSWPAVDERTFGDGAHSITWVHERDRDRFTAHVHGLPWGHALAVTLRMTSRQCDLAVRLPDADIGRVLERLQAIEQADRAAAIP